MLNINPFPESFGQSILDSIVHSTSQIFSVQNIGAMLSMAIPMALMAWGVFALVSVGFFFWSMIRDRAWGYANDEMDWYIAKERAKRRKEKSEKKKKEIIKNVADDTPAVS